MVSVEQLGQNFHHSLTHATLAPVLLICPLLRRSALLGFHGQERICFLDSQVQEHAVSVVAIPVSLYVLKVSRF